MAAIESEWVVTGERSSRGPFSSIAALYKTVGHKRVYGPYERPPFPIIIDKPSWSDVIASWRISDYIMAGTIYGTGVLWSFTISRPFPTVM